MLYVPYIFILLFIMKWILLVFLLLTCLGPLYMVLIGGIDFKTSYLDASRETTNMTPLPAEYPDAIIQVYSARAFNWRGIFSTHTWLVIKPKKSTNYIVYHVVGWRAFRGLPALSIANDIPDRKWFNQIPEILLDIRGENAEKLIPKINEAVKDYPYANEYITWPGPNSNTFTASIARKVPELQLQLPSNAIGKDYTGKDFFVRAPSGTGYQLSFYGYFGIMLAWKEGLEINILGLVYGLSPSTLTIKLPGFGDIKLLHNQDK